MSKYQRLLSLLSVSLLCGASLATLPDGVKLPLLLLDVNFNQDTPGQPPRLPGKAQIEAAGQDEWKMLPVRTYTTLEFVTRTRTAVVRKEANGLIDQPVLFTVTENAQPHWGPRMWLSIPPAVAAQGKRYHLSLDVAMATIAKMGGVHLWDVAQIEFFEDGTVKLGQTELGRYKPNTPVHIDADIDADAKTVAVYLDGKKEQTVTLPWSRPKAGNFGAILLNGILPGGHCYLGRIAFDNIRVTLEEAR